MLFIIYAIHFFSSISSLSLSPFLFHSTLSSSDAARTKQTLHIMQQQVPRLLEAEIHFVSSFYSIAAMDGQTADHLQKVICKYSRDEILTIMWVPFPIQPFNTCFQFFPISHAAHCQSIHAMLQIMDRTDYGTVISGSGHSYYFL